MASSLFWMARGHQPIPAPRLAVVVVIVSVIAVVGAAGTALEIGPNLRIGPQEFSDLRLVIAQIPLVDDVGIVAVTLGEVGIRRHLAIPLVSRSHLVVVADLLLDVIAHVGMIVEQFANAGPLLHFTPVVDDVGVPAVHARKILVVLILEESMPTLLRATVVAATFVATVVVAIAARIFRMVILRISRNDRSDCQHGR